MKNIYGMALSDLETYFISIGDKKFKAVQVLNGFIKNEFLVFKK